MHIVSNVLEKHITIMKPLKNQSFEKRKEKLFVEINILNKVNVSSHFDNPTVLLGICSNCLNNSNCVWMESKKITCEEYN